MALLRSKRGQQIVVETIIVFGAGLLILGMVTEIFSYANEKITKILTRNYLESISRYISSAILITYEAGKDLKSPTTDQAAVSWLYLDVPKRVLNSPYIIRLRKEGDALRIDVGLAGGKAERIYLTGFQGINLPCCMCDGRGHGAVWENPTVVTSESRIVIKYYKPFRRICDARRENCSYIPNAICVEVE